MGLAFGPARVRGEDEGGSVTQSVLDAGKGFADARVVHDAAVVERDVEVDAHEDAMIVQREIANGKLGHGTPVVGRLLVEGRAPRPAGRARRPSLHATSQKLHSSGRNQADQISDTAGVSPLIVS